MPRKAGPKFYAVRVGKNTGVFNTWAEAQQQVNGWPKACHKSFASQQEAQAFVEGVDAPWAPPAAATAAPSKPKAKRAAGGAAGGLRGVKRRRSEEGPPQLSAWDQLRLELAAPGPAKAAKHDTGRAFRLASNWIRTHRKRGTPEGALDAVQEFDGGARGNPGVAGCGAVLYDDRGRRVAVIAEALGHRTSNYAEYTGLLRGLEAAQELGAQLGVAEVDIYGDSKLVTEQVKGSFRVKAEGLKPLHRSARQLLGGFRRWSIQHVPREDNTTADTLSNVAMDGRGWLGHRVLVEDMPLLTAEPEFDPAEAVPDKDRESVGEGGGPQGDLIPYAGVPAEDGLGAPVAEHA